MKIKATKMLLFITLCLLLIGVASANDVELDDTSEEIISDQSPDLSYSEATVKDDDLNNQIVKKEDVTDKTVKTASKIQSKVSIDYVPDINVEEGVLISGTLSDVNNNPIKNVPLKVDVNGDVYETDTDDYGDYFGEYFADTPGQKTIRVSFAGNSKYTSSSNTRTFNVVGQQDTYIILNSIPEVSCNNYVTISGYYYYGKSQPLRSTPMRININGQQFTANTNNNGYFTYNYKTNKAGTNTVTVTYPGNSRFKQATTSQTFNVKTNGPQNTYIKLNKIPEVAYNSYTTISGYYYYGNNQPLRSTPMRININGKTYTTTTNNNGYFTYNYQTEKVFKNTATVTYPGNSRFKAATTSQSFNVKITNPINTYINLNNINDVTNGNTATISGYYYYGNNQPLTSTPMRININGQQYATYTNNNGYFTYNYKTNKAGTNTVTVTYPGNKNFKQATTTKTFNVKTNGPQNTYIKLNKIPDVEYYDYTTISGHYYYANNQPLRYTPLKLNINDESFTVTTDSNGYFEHEHFAEKVFKNKVTVSYPGNARFKGATASQTFNVKVTSPVNTYLELDWIDNVKLGNYATIKGYYHYGYQSDSGPLRRLYPLTQTTINLNINGVKYTTKTDNNGYFTYNYKTNKAGFTKVTASYAGNANFEGDSDYTTFNVYENKLTMNIIPLTNGNGNRVNRNKDLFEAWYQTYDAQHDKGVHLEIYPEDMVEMGDTAYNLLLDAKFYFRNKAGNIYTDYYDEGKGYYMYHSLVPGYTPYKVDVYYKKMTQNERKLSEDYYYDCDTGKWFYW